jgi:uncharacterized ParB-like nuclease family protein
MEMFIQRIQEAKFPETIEVNGGQLYYIKSGCLRLALLREKTGSVYFR